MAKTDRSGDRQFAALPYRVDPQGGYQVLLVTSRETGRWIVPKGWPIKGKKAHHVAEIEAFEEAGVRGTVGKKPVGDFAYAKRMPDGEDRLILVTVYPLLIKDELSAWPEAGERRRCWFGQKDAAAQVDEGQLARLILEFGR
jgi:8-oxo-dGTP pyrophosphatase MutT (NUDIX family)